MPSRKYKSTKKHVNKTRKNRRIVGNLIELSKIPALKGALIVKGNFIAKGGSGGIMSNNMKKAVNFAHNVMNSVNGKRPRYIRGGADATEEPVNTASEEPINAAAEEPVNAAAEEPVNVAAEEPVNAAAEEPVNAATEEPVNAAAEEASEPSGEESFVDSGKDEVDAKDEVKDEAKEEDNKEEVKVEDNKEEVVEPKTESKPVEPKTEAKVEKPESNDEEEEVTASQELEPGKMLVKVKPTIADVFDSKREFYVVQDTLEPPKGGSRKNRRKRKSRNTKRRVSKK